MKYVLVYKIATKLFYQTAICTFIEWRKKSISLYILHEIYR